MGRSITGISLLTTEFGISPIHWYWTESPVGPKYEMVALIEENFVRSIDVYSPTFNLLQFLLLQVDQNIFKSLLLSDIPGQARPTLPTLQEYIRMAC